MTTSTRRRWPSRRTLAIVLGLVFVIGTIAASAAAMQMLGLPGPDTADTDSRGSATPSPSASPAATPTESPRPVRPSPTPTRTATPTPTATPSPTATRAPTPAATPIATPVPAPVATPAPTRAPTAVPTAAPAPVPPPSAGLPPCRYDDILTARRGYGDWATTLLDTTYMLPSTYHPGDLVDTSSAGVNGGYLLRSLVISDLRALADAARASGVQLSVISGFRSYQQQQATFNHWVGVVGYDAALRVSARPGHSEHQLGTAIDFSTPGGAAPWTHADWGITPTGAWLAANAWKYGFVMTYPKGRSAETCYDYEPWHYRYVGRDIAQRITASGLTPREFFWRLGH